MDFNKHGVYYRQCEAFVNYIDNNPQTRIVLQYISLNSDLWPNLLRKTAITATFYLPGEEIVCLREK